MIQQVNKILSRCDLIETNPGPSLLILPPELRLMVYQHVIDADQDHPTIHHPLRNVCKFIHDEFTPPLLKGCSITFRAKLSECDQVYINARSSSNLSKPQVSLHTDEFWKSSLAAYLASFGVLWIESKYPAHQSVMFKNLLRDKPCFYFTDKYVKRYGTALPSAEQVMATEPLKLRFWPKGLEISSRKGVERMMIGFGGYSGQALRTISKSAERDKWAYFSEITMPD